ncbi:MAG: hypothetical protein QXO52_04385 [Thermosphaera sp.]
MIRSSPFLIALSILMMACAALCYGATAEGIDEKVDCRFLGIMLRNVLERVSADDYSVRDEISVLVRINLPEPLRSRHVKIYNYLLDYLEGVEYIHGKNVSKTPLEIVANLREFYAQFEDAVKAYMVQLSSCINDQTLFSTINSLTSIHVKSVLEKLPILFELVSSETRTSNFISISLNKLSFSPGDIIYANISVVEKEITLQNEFQIALWPTLEIIGKGLLIPQGGYYSGWFQVPSLYELSNRVDLRSLQEDNNLLIIARGSLNGSQVVGIKFFKLRLSKPMVYMTIDPPLAYMGDSLKIKIQSNGVYFGRLFINNSLIASLNLTPGQREVVLTLDPSNTSAGLVTITLSVEMTEASLPANITSSAIIARKRIPIHLETPLIITTLHNSIRLRIILEDPSSLPVKISIVRPQRVELETNTSQSIEAEISFPWVPVISSEILIVATPENPSFDVCEERFTLFIINPSLTVIWGYGLTLAFMFVRRREAVFTFYIKTLRNRGTLRQESEKTSDFKGLLETKSLIAKIYYETLNKLNIDPPRVAETLREHFDRISLSTGLKKILRKLLLLAERDLYGKIKPKIEEADELVEEVLNYENG